ncbi:MAG: aminotransferase class I/II-fold pyridoxal phosphate-dependent enzyme [Candidatus Micrarchaeia archaeon]
MANPSIVTTFKPEGKPQPAFADGSWKNPGTSGLISRANLGGVKTETIAAHAGVSRDGKNHAVMPTYTGTTVSTATCEELADNFSNAVVAGRKGQIYSRLGTPNTFALECTLADMHPGCADAMVFASGMAAISHTLLSLVAPGDNVVVHRGVYGCTDNLLSMKFPSWGFEARFVDMRESGAIEAAVDNRTRAVFFETPSNPVLDIINIANAARDVKGRCPVIVDNTFASPVGQNPFENGANIVIYSMTKSIGGNSNATGGAVLGSGAFLEHLFYTRKDLGGMLAAKEAAAFLDGLKTLPLRYPRMAENATEVAHMLMRNPNVEKVHYPGMGMGYPYGQMKSPGHMVAFELKKGLEGGKALINNLNMIVNAVSLGSVESLISHPASTTHACVPKEQREAKGITDGLVRLSVGIENIGDIMGDLEQAFRKVASL